MKSTVARELKAIEVELRTGNSDPLRCAAQIQDLVVQLAQQARDHETAAKRGVTLLERASRVTRAEGVRQVATELLDTVMLVVGARRGFVGVGTAEAWSLVVARTGEGTDLVAPEQALSMSVVTHVLRDGVMARHDDAVDHPGSRSAVKLRLRSVVCFPVQQDRATLGFVYLDDPTRPGRFDAKAVDAVRAWLPLMTACLVRATRTQQDEGLPGILTRSAAFRATLDDLRRIAGFDASVLLTGETGTGKSSIARATHQVSARSLGSFIHLNCGAIPEALMESELFGAEAGAYTGAKVRRIGKIEAANGGTIFFDELDAMPASCQVKLLVALQERSITRLGGTQTIPIDVRIIAAMSTDPQRALHEGKLREDLFYRLSVFVARILPLRERREDIPLLARHILTRSRERYALPDLVLSPAAEQQLIEHRWPGNVRELENALDRAALLASDGRIERFVLGVNQPMSAGPDPVVRQVQAAAAAIADQLMGRPELRGVELTGVLEGALLMELERRLGSQAAAMEHIGRGAEVAARNHRRTWARDVGRFSVFASRIGSGARG